MSLKELLIFGLYVRVQSHLLQWGSWRTPKSREKKRYVGLGRPTIVCLPQGAILQQCYYRIWVAGCFVERERARECLTTTLTSPLPSSNIYPGRFSLASFPCYLPKPGRVSIAWTSTIQCPVSHICREETD
ncbi:unnamed protein product [Ectocarpus sp. 12 AP-2014]